VLEQYELNVNELVLVVDMIQSGVSRHLKILVESGLLTSRRDGSFMYYAATQNELLKAVVFLVNQSPEQDDILRRDLERAREMIIIRQDRTKRFFKTVAPQWDRLKREVLGDFDLNARIRKKISFQGNVADLGCGTGELIRQLALEGPETLMGIDKLIGIDSSPEMLDQARLRLSGTHNAELRLGELEHLPMKNREIDTAVMNMVLHHISQPELSIAEAYRVLKPGGIFVLSDFEKHDQEKIKKILGGSWLGFEREKITHWLAAAGFVFKSVETYPVHHQLTINLFLAQK
jgi:ArsR family transcriptional regulator